MHYGDNTQGAGRPFASYNGHGHARYYLHDLKAMVDGRGSHPSIIQFETFNEQVGSCLSMFRDVDSWRMVVP